MPYQTNYDEASSHSSIEGPFESAEENIMYNKLMRVMETGSPQDMDFTEYQNIIKELYPDVSICTQKKMNSYIKAVRKAHAFYSGNLGKGEELRNVIVDDRGHVAQVITKRANYEEEIAKAKEFAQDQEMFGTDLSGNDSDRYTLSGLFDTFKNGVKHYGSKAFGASFMSTILGYACGLAKKLIWSAASYIWNKYVTERVKDAMYAMAVVLILIVCHCMNLGNCVAGLLQTVLLIVARGDSILRVALSSVAMAYVARDALAGWQQIRPVTNVYTNVERPVEKEKKLRVLKGKFQGNTLKDQVFEGNGTLFTSLMKIFCCLIAVCTMDKLPSTATFMGLLRKCKEVPQAFKGVLEMGKLIEGAFDSAFGACFENCFGVGTMKANPIPSEVLDCTTRIIELTKLSNLARVSKESALCAEADALYQQYSKFRVDYSGNREVVNHLNMCAGNARDLFAQARSTSPKANEARTRPPAVIFTGQSGTGKSVVMNYVVAGILVKEGLIKKDMTDEEIELRKGECVYPRMPEQEYWDGYYGQTITIYDDFAQMRDSVVRPNVEFFELIRTTNMFPCPLHMAELSQKANTYFSSKYIFMTSNANQLEIESLICPQAVQTRFAYWVRVELDERIVRKEAGVLSGTIDNEKVLQLYGTYNTPEIYRFKVQDGVNEETTLNIRELIDLIYSKRQLNERGFASLQTGVGDFARGMFQAWPSFSEKAKEFMVRPDYEKTYEWTKQKIAGALAALRERVENTRKWCLNIDPLKTITIVVGVAIMCYCNQEHFAKWSKAEGIGWLGSNSGWTLECVDLAGLHKYVKKNVVGVSNAKLTEEELCNWDFEEIADTLEESDKGMIRVVFQGKEEVEVVFFFHGVEQGKMVVAEATRLSLDDKIKMAVKMFTESGRSKQQAAAKAKIESGRSKTVIPKVVVESELESGTSKQFVVKHQVEACGESGTSKRLQIPKAQLEILRPNKEDSARLEQWASRNAQENVVGPVRNAYWQLRDFESRESLAPVVAIGGRCYMINTHYWDFIKRKERIVLSPWGSETGIEMMTKELDSTPYMLGGEETDLTLILLPSYTPINLALWKRFHTSQDAAKLDQQVAVMVSPAAGIDNGPLERCTGKFMSMYTEPMDLEKQDGSVRTLKAHCYVFDSRSYCGDCGGLYVIDDNNFEGKIIAFHFGGAASGGALAVPLIRQHFEFLANAQEIVLPKFVVQDEEGEAPVVGAVYQGYVREPPGMNMKTSIVKSMLHGHVQETTVAPAQLGYILKPDGPGLRGLKKVCGDVPHVDPEKLYYAAESWKVLAFSGKYPREWRKKLTFEEAVAGVPGREYIKPINRSTSAGYPWCLVKKPGTKGKQGWLGFADWDLSQPGALELRTEVERLDALLKQGVLEPSVFNDTLKDETRPIEKVQAGKTRVFAAAPMCGVVLVRQYFGRFVDAITSNRIHNEVCVGIQAHSTDWTHLASRLRGVGDNVVAGDFSDYDGSLNPAILKKIFQLVNEWYADEYSQERMLLAENLCHSYHVAGPRVYRWTHSQPSGNPLTAILNSIYNSLVTRIAWMYLAEERGFAEFYPGAAFNQHVRMASYGDDNLISVSSEVKDWFNMERLVAGFARAGMKYTSEAKDGQVYTTKSLVNCSFLKRGFRKWRSWWLAPLQQDSINEALNWCHKNANTRNNMEEVARTQVAEWALHDTEKFEEMRDKIQMAVFKVMGRYIESIDQERYIQTMLFADYGTLFPLLCYS